MQTNYNTNMDEGYEGLIASLENSNVKTGGAEGNVPFGFGVVGSIDKEKQVKLPENEVATLLFYADFVTSNTINLRVNGVAIAEVTFTTSQAVTSAALIAAIDLLVGVTCIAGGTNRTFIIKAENTDIVISDVVIAGGASQTSGGVVYSTDEVFRGIAVHTHKQANLTDDTANYGDGEAVGYLTKGEIWVPATKAVSIDSAAYVIVGGADKGKFTDTSLNNIAIGGTFRKTISTAGLTKVEINNP